MGYFIQRCCVRSLGWWLTEQGLIPHTLEARPRGPCVGRVGSSQGLSPGPADSVCSLCLHMAFTLHLSVS